jgi:hypothetical protein
MPSNYKKDIEEFWLISEIRSEGRQPITKNIEDLWLIVGDAIQGLNIIYGLIQKKSECELLILFFNK